jgi:hypothetical protein
VNRRPSLVAAALAMWALLGWSSRAAAFCRTTVCQDCSNDANGCTGGAPIIWKSACVTYSMQHDGTTHVGHAQAAAAIEKAFQAWQIEPCPGGDALPAIRVRTAFGEAACRRHEYNQSDGNANIVMFRDDDWPYTNATNALALTTVTYNFKTGEIYDADMEINATEQLSVADPPAATAFDLQSIITHEAGHFLGLNHSLDPNATMWAEYTRGSESFRRLSADDIAGICEIYPPARVAPCSEAPRQGFSPTCGIAPTSGGSCALGQIGGGTTAWGAGALFALAASARARRARRRGAP